MKRKANQLDNEPEAVISHSRDLINNQQWQAALTRLTKYVRQNNPELSEFYCLIGQCHKKLTNYEDAIAAYTQAIAINPHDKEAYFARSKTYALLKKFDLALNDIEHAIIIDPNDSSFIAHLINLFRKENQLSQVLPKLERLTVLNDKHVIAWGFISDIHRELKNYEFALNAVNKVIEIKPDEAYYYHIRSAVYYKDKKYIHSFIDFITWAELDPSAMLRTTFFPSLGGFVNKVNAEDINSFSDDNNKYFLLLRAIKFCDEKKYELALETINKALVIDPNASFLNQRKCEILLLQNKMNELSLEVDKWITKRPNDTLALFWSAKLSILNEEFQPAFETIEKGLTLLGSTLLSKLLSSFPPSESTEV
ncbi:MAG: tetratricopeptide repeat protein, partial [Silvanigrellaceae bacterium]|nr:tetratricopeptide repeat protein [Silvanigrellaceae bacterium]